MTFLFNDGTISFIYEQIFEMWVKANKVDAMQQNASVPIIASRHRTKMASSWELRGICNNLINASSPVNTCVRLYAAERM